MAEHLIETISRISTPPPNGAAFDEWLDATDGIDLLKENIQSDEFVFYATPGGTFIHSIPGYDAALHAPQSGSARCGDSVVGDRHRSEPRGRGEIVEAAGTEG